MRRTAAVITAVALLLCACCVQAEEGRIPPAIDAPSSWTDAENERATVDILPGTILSGDYQDELVMEVFWADSAWDEWVFTLVLTPETTTDRSVTYSFFHGTAVRYSYDDDGNRIDEAASNEAFSGTVTAEQDGDHETILILECDNATLPNMTLYRDRMPCPSPEELAANIIEPVMELEEGTAGADLKQARVAEKLIRYAVQARLYAVDPEEFRRNLDAALEDVELSDGEYRLFMTQKTALADLMTNVSGLSGGGNAEQMARARALFSDAGVMDSVDEMMDSSLSSAYSLNRLLTSMESIGKGKTK